MTLTTDTLHLVSSLDLVDEATAAVNDGQSVERRTWTDDGQTHELLYFAEAGRAAICGGGKSEWTDATSADDAIARYEAGEMVN